MVANLAVPHRALYGAIELKQYSQRSWFYGFFIAVGLHVLMMSSYYLANLFESPPTRDAKPGHPRGITILPIPPSISMNNLPPAIKAGTPRTTASGLPVPVPDAVVDPEQTIATQEELGSLSGSDLWEEAGIGEVSADPVGPVEQPPPDFVAREVEPVIIHQVQPVYPEFAYRAGLEGTVWIKIWVDKEGKPRQLIVLKSTAEIFDESALEAARQFLFTPAYMNSGPVDVWVSIPFRFRIGGGD